VSGTNGLFNPQVLDDPRGPLRIQQPDPGQVSPADAWTANTRMLTDYLNQQQAQAQQQGLWAGGQVWEGGHPTAAGVVTAGQQYGNALMMGTTAPGDVGAPGFTAFHGSPYDFERFDTSKIGTGEGAQAYGHGLYFAGNEGVARSYREGLSTASTPKDVAAEYLHEFGGDRDAAIAQLTDHAQGGFGWSADQMDNVKGALALLKSGAEVTPKQPGHMYEVNIGADPTHFLDWDKPLSEQSQHVQDAVGSVLDAHPEVKKSVDFQADFLRRPPSASAVYQSLANRTDPAYAAQKLQDAGIPGIRYLDQGSRAAGQGTSNTVVFDPATIAILRKYGIAGLITGGGAAATAAGGNQPPT
jgi:hypothetical protein